ncbi:DUF2232 domain-containing protein [Halanaerobaculum tunisiense]
MQTRALIEGALLAGFTAVMTILGLYFPLGSLLLLITPLPLIILAARWNSRLSIIASVVNAIILILFINPALLFLTVFYTGLVGVAIGAAFEEGFSPKLILTVGTIAVVISLVINLLVVTYMLEIDIVQQIKSVLDLVAKFYQEIDISEEVLATIKKQFLTLLTTTYPTLFLCSGLLVATSNYYLSSKVLNRFAEFDYPPLFSLEEVKLPRFTLLFYFFAVYFNQHFIWMNIYVLVSFLLSVEGLAVAYYYFLANKLNRLTILVGVIFFPLTIQLLFLVGLADVIFDFRGLNQLQK